MMAGDLQVGALSVAQRAAQLIAQLAEATSDDRLPALRGEVLAGIADTTRRVPTP